MLKKKLDLLSTVMAMSSKGRTVLCPWYNGEASSSLAKDIAVLCCPVWAETLRRAKTRLRVSCDDYSSDSFGIKF
jgi:hypothetical protein